MLNLEYAFDLQKRLIAVAAKKTDEIKEHEISLKGNDVK